jgi:hypothetical protein
MKTRKHFEALAPDEIRKHLAQRELEVFGRPARRTRGDSKEKAAPLSRAAGFNHTSP